jgi:hypothetical protein
VDARAPRRPATRPSALSAGLATLLLATTALAGGTRRTEAPPRLADTGLYAGPGAETLARGVRTWSPQYPLWSDGATKRRWILLPRGRSIDASDPDAWVFPVGTRLWKEFTFEGRRVETRYMERRADGSWLYATYRWSADGTDATRAPATGVPGAVRLAGGSAHDLPSVGDCEACHGAGRTPVLGFSALQLSPDRDPRAPNAEAPATGAVDLRSAVRSGLVRRLPRALLDTPPMIQAQDEVSRAALGYLHGNCGGCHDLRGELASLGLDLSQRVAPAMGTGPLATAVGVTARYQPSEVQAPMLRIAAGRPERSALLHRMSSRAPADQMPPIGTHRIDAEAVELIRAWITTLESTEHVSAPVVER